jgi:hypothetical protein
MEVFPMPQSNKKTAILPNLHHTGLQSCCSLLLALRPSGCARPQSHAVPMHGGIRTSWAMPDPLITGIPAPPSCAGLQPWIRPTPCWNTRPLDMPPDPWEQGSPLPGHSGPRLELVSACEDTRPLKPPSFRPCSAPAMDGMTTAPHLRLPTHQDLLCSSSVWNDWSSAPLGQAPAWHETAASTSPPRTLLLGWVQPQLYRLFIKPLHRAPPWATAIRRQECLRETHRLDWTLKK